MNNTVEYEPFPNDEGKNALQERLEVPALVRTLGIPSGGRMLEIGCGRGIALPGLARLCEPEALVGLDIAPELLDEARMHLDGSDVDCDLVCGDVRRMPFDDGSFDVVVDFGTLYHIARPELGLFEVARVLRPGGIFVEETKLSQALSHPSRSRGRRIPWEADPRLAVSRSAGLWTARVRRLSLASVPSPP